MTPLDFPADRTNSIVYEHMLDNVIHNDITIQLPSEFAPMQCSNPLGCP